MARRHAWHSAGVLVLAAACSQEITAPGTCPEFCPSTQIRMVDTLLLSSVTRDSSFRGYVQPHQALRMQVSTPGTGPEIQGRGVVRFREFSDSVIEASGKRPIVAVDSFTITIALDERPIGATGLELLLHRLPVTVDSLVTLADVEAFFDDSTLIETLPLPDSLLDTTLTFVLAAEALEDIAADSFVVAMGFALQAPQPAFASLGTAEGGQGVFLTRYAKVDSLEGVIVERSEVRGVTMDTYVLPAQTDPPPEALVAGGVPSARSLLRLAIPPAIIDSGNIVRATLIVVPSEPVRGAAGDAVFSFVEGLSADFGPKSPLIAAFFDSSGVGNIGVPVGSTDTIRVDVTRSILPWRGNPALPRSLMVRVRPEGAVLGEVRFGSSRMTGMTPALQVTYIAPSRLGGT